MTNDQELNFHPYLSIIFSHIIIIILYLFLSFFLCILGEVFKFVLPVGEWLLDFCIVNRAIHCLRHRRHLGDTIPDP